VGAETSEPIRERGKDPTARPADTEIAAALERARSQIEELSAVAARLEAALPHDLAQAVRRSMEAEAAPVARNLAEVRGLTGQTIRRLERIQTDLAAERYARIDDLELLVDLFVSGWRGIEQRLERMEQMLNARDSATVHRIAEAS
jgi:hypothetical protein